MAEDNMLSISIQSCGVKGKVCEFCNCQFSVTLERESETVRDLRM